MKKELKYKIGANATRFVNKYRPGLSLIKHAELKAMLEDFAQKQVSMICKKEAKYPFKDSDGNHIEPGDRILIVKHRKYSFMNNIEADVIWDPRHGELRYQCELKTGHGAKIWKREDDFIGIIDFKKLPLADHSPTTRKW